MPDEKHYVGTLLELDEALALLSGFEARITRVAHWHWRCTVKIEEERLREAEAEAEAERHPHSGRRRRASAGESAYDRA
jgi:hypothetical protein